MKTLLSLLLILYSLGTTYAQTQTRILSGVVISENQPFIGMGISLVDDFENIVMTNIDGEFKLEVPKSGTFELQLHYCICIKHPKKIKIKEKDKNIILKRRKCNFKKIRIREKN